MGADFISDSINTHFDIYLCKHLNFVYDPTKARECLAVLNTFQ